MGICVRICCHILANWLKAGLGTMPVSAAAMCGILKQLLDSYEDIRSHHVFQQILNVIYNMNLNLK
jgi:hypothetical protein